MPQGFLALLLHAHLPFVRHPEHDSFLEEDWLFEAVAECYLPLIALLRGIAADEVPCRLTLSVSPPLAEMLGDPLLQSRCLRYLESRLALANQEVHRTRHDVALHPLARMYQKLYLSGLAMFDKSRRNLLGALAELQDEGILEIITCPATHPFMPFVSRQEVRRAQLAVARKTCKKYFGRLPRGLWLAECGYEPEVESLLGETGFGCVVLDAHGLLFGSPRPRMGIFAPVRSPSGIVAFGRDLESSRQVWSSHGGYPGDADYREFYRDLGYDGDYEYVRLYLHPDGVRRNLGIKYHRVTGPVDLGQRALYDRAKALAKVSEHAGNFVGNRSQQIQYLHERLRQRPIIVSPYDAELFGHWWFEGPQFLDRVIRLAAPQQVFKLITLSDAAALYSEPMNQEPAASSWGEEGYHKVWLNQKTQWMYPHQHEAENIMVALANQFPSAEGILRRALNQAGRELMLAQSSDWAFLVSRGTSVPYAVRRFKEHIHRFQTIHQQILAGDVHADWLQQVEAQDNLFSDLDYRVFSSVPWSTLFPSEG